VPRCFPPPWCGVWCGVLSRLGALELLQRLSTCREVRQVTARGAAMQTKSPSMKHGQRPSIACRRHTQTLTDMPEPQAARQTRCSKRPRLTLHHPPPAPTPTLHRQAAALGRRAGARQCRCGAVPHAAASLHPRAAVQASSVCCTLAARDSSRLAAAASRSRCVTVLRHSGRAVTAVTPCVWLAGSAPASQEATR
jgi:hypothetical protein